VDRIELGTQSLDEYRSFKNVGEEVQATEDSFVLRTKLKSTDLADTLIVTSIQKLNQIKDEDGGMIARDIETINAKRIVFIVDEAHRSTFGDMLITIKATFPRAVFFGFTGTPIHIENEVKGNTTADIFGSELHRYSIAHGIRDKNVLGFDLYKMPTFQDREVRKVVGLAQAKAKDEAEAFANPKKKAVYLKFLNEMEMAGRYDDSGKYIKGVEDYLPNVQYSSTTDHQKTVVDDIINNWVTLSQNSKFHAILATSSIHEAIEYYRLLKSNAPDLRVTALFDPHTDLQGDGAVKDERFKQAGLEEIIGDYNMRYFGKPDVFKVASHAKFKKDIAWRLAHKEVYKNVEPDKQLDLLIVVNQMLTGFDSKWVNTLYIDKLMEYAHIIQAFSRTNRLFDPYEKPFGVIRYYRRTHTMERNIKLAVKAYSGDKEFALHVDKLPENIRKMNQLFDEISAVFARAGVPDFTRLPEDDTARAKFALLFRELYACKEAARLQGFRWPQLVYEYEEGGQMKSVELNFDERTYNALLLRYKELLGGGSGSTGGSVPYDIDSHISELNTGKINADYMNSQFDIYMKVLNTGDESAVDEALNDLHKSFSSLTTEEQRYAEIFLRDVRRGEVTVEAGKTLRDYITEYQLGAKNKQIKDIAAVFGLDEKLLRNLMKLQIAEADLNKLNRFTNLTDTVDMKKAKSYFEAKEGKVISTFTVKMKVSEELRRFVLEGGFHIETDE